MGFFDLFRPNWKHSDVEVRLRAIRSLDPSQETVLAQVIRSDADEHIRRVAVKKLENPRLLRQIAGELGSPALREAAEERAAELLMAEACADRGPAGPLAALELISGARDLANVARRALRAEVRLAAVGRLSDGKLLADLALRGEDVEAQLAALARVSDPAALAAIAADARSKVVRAAARERLPATAPAAAAVPAPAAGPPKHQDNVRRAQQLALCMAAEVAARHDATDSEMADLRKQWDDLDGEEAKPALRARFTAAFALHRQRQKAHQDDLRRRAAAREAAAAKAAAAAPLKVALPEPAAPPPKPAPEPAPKPAPEPPPAPSPEAIAAEAARRQQAEERARAERAQLLAAVEAAARRLETAAAGDRKAPLDRALKEAPAFEAQARRAAAGADLEPLRRRLAAAKEKAAARLVELAEAESWQRWANLPKLDQICQEAEALAEVIETAPDKRRAPVVLGELRERWKRLAGPPSDRQTALWERFKKAGDLVHERSREFFAKLEEEHAAAAALKADLCAKVEALAESSEWKETAEKIVALQAEWKLAGHVPGERGEALWTRFRAACDKFFARREDIDKSRDAEREANLARAEAMCAHVEGLATSTEWRQTAEIIKDLQAQWRGIGDLPRGKAGPLWKRFRAACDAFFEARTAAFVELDAQRAGNLARKQELCERAEALAAAPPEHPEAALEQARGLQAEWQTIGHVPREVQQMVWQRFRAACDAVFALAPAAEAAAPPPEATPPSGISGFTNRIPLAKALDKIVLRKSDSPEED